MAMHDFFKGLKPVIASGVAGVSGVAPPDNTADACAFPKIGERNTLCNTTLQNDFQGVCVGVATKNKAECWIGRNETPATPKTPVQRYDVEYWQDLYEERAAIMEFEGELPRLEAERLANEWIHTLKKENDDGQHFTMH